MCCNALIQAFLHIRFAGAEAGAVLVVEQSARLLERRPLGHEEMVVIRKEMGGESLVNKRTA